MDTIVTLYEHFNTSNQTSPHFERHESFVEDIREPDCALVTLLAHEARCNYITVHQQCADIHIIHYYQLLYCTIGSEEYWKVAAFVAIVMFILFYLYVIMSSTSTKFFCPSISVFAQLLGLSENVAGVTLLAFANGANDLISGIAGKDKKSRVYFNDTIGSCIFLVNIVASILLLISPFHMQSYSFLRDVCFLLLYVVVVDYFYKRAKAVQLLGGYIMISIYIAYISVVILEHFLIKEARKRFRLNELRGSISKTYYLKHLTFMAPIMLKTKETHDVIEVETPPTSFDIMHPRNHDLWKHMWISLNPIQAEKWKTNSWLWCLYEIIQMPYMILLNLFLPVVDFEEERRGWSKLLNCIQIVILPLWISWLVFGWKSVLYVPIIFITLFVSVPLTIYIFKNTRTYVTPYNHTYMSFLTLLGASTIVYNCALEILSIFDALGIITGCSNTFLGATLLAWSNSFNDLLSNIILAQQGHVTMGFSGCFGAAIYNYFSSLAFFVTYGVYESPENKAIFPEGTVGETCQIYLVISLLIFVFGAYTTNFQLRRSLGLVLVLIYVIFFIFTILGEFEIIHHYGTDHLWDLKMQFHRLDPHIEEKFEIDTNVGSEIV